MQVSYVPPVDHHGQLSKKRMHLKPMLPIPVTYETAAVPSYAPFGTEYTPGHSMKIIGSRRIAYPESMLPPSEIRSTKTIDPDIAPTKALQHVQQVDYGQWPQQSKSRYDTTYRTEYINRLRHPDQIARPIRNYKNSFNQYSVLPPIATKPPPPINTNTYLNRNQPSATSHVTETRSQASKDSDYAPSYYNGPLPSVPPPPPPAPVQLSMPPQEQKRPMNPEDSFLPQEPVLLTDYEEQRLSDQIREQIGNGNVIDRLKLFFQELTAYDPQMTMHVHYSTIQMLAQQLGFNLRDDTLRFAMCKFVSPSRARGMVNYEDMIRYFGKCLSSIHPNPYGPYHSSSFPDYHHEGSPSRHQQNSHLHYSHQYHP